MDPFQNITALSMPLKEKFGWRWIDSCYYNSHSVSHGSRINFYFQVLLFKKYILCGYIWLNGYFSGSGGSMLKMLRGKVISLDATKSICESREKDDISRWRGVWKKLTPVLKDDSDKSTLQGQVNCRCSWSFKI